MVEVPALCWIGSFSFATHAMVHDLFASVKAAPS